MSDVPAAPQYPLQDVLRAVVDDTQHLWIAFSDGLWFWVDIAGFLEDHALQPGSEVRPVLAMQGSSNLLIAPDVLLPLHLIRTHRSEALAAGVLVQAVRLVNTAWYRPLVLSGVVSGQRTVRTPRELARTLSLKEGELALAAQRHAVTLRTLTRRLDDLCTVVAGDGVVDPADVLRERWAIYTARSLPATPWMAIAQGRIGLVEQLFATRSGASQRPRRRS